jgi:hypothetical protein
VAFKAVTSPSILAEVSHYQTVGEPGRAIYFATVEIDCAQYNENSVTQQHGIGAHEWFHLWQQVNNLSMGGNGECEAEAFAQSRVPEYVPFYRCIDGVLQEKPAVVQSKRAKKNAKSTEFDFADGRQSLALAVQVPQRI